MDPMPRASTFVSEIRVEESDGSSYVVNGGVNDEIAELYKNAILSSNQNIAIVESRIEKVSLETAVNTYKAKTPNNPDYLAIAIACYYMELRIAKTEANSDVEKIKMLFTINSWQSLYRRSNDFTKENSSFSAMFKKLKQKRSNELSLNVQRFIKNDPKAVQKMKDSLSK